MAIQKFLVVLLLAFNIFGNVFAVKSFAKEQLVAKEREHQVPQEWSRVSRAQEDERIRTIFALKQKNLDRLEKRFWEVSDPQHADYGKFMTIEQIADLIAPQPSQVKPVIRWLHYNNISKYEITKSKDFIIAELKASQVEKMFGVELFEYQHSQRNISVIRALGPYYLPQSVAQVIDFVGGFMRFPRPMKVFTKSTMLGDVDPNYIKQTFNIPSNTQGSSSRNSQAVAQFLQQYYNPDDLTTFQQTFGLPVQAVAVEQGPNDPSNPGDEAELDIQYIMSMGVNIPTWFVSTGGEYKGQEPFLDWIVNMSNTANSPWVHSVSYGDVESSLTTDYTGRLNVEFQKYGLMGRSILFASGDDGAGCTSNCNYFSPNFPASSPFVTAVGGMEVFQDTLQGDPISSGGFSNYFAQPAYQSAAVAAYAAGGLPPSSYYNQSGRAMPDVCSFSEDVVVIIAGEQIPVGGTSCAAPVFSGVIALINDARLVKNKTPLGFLNPFIYQTYAKYSDAFIDIVGGNNANDCCNYGFDCRAGYDLVTGVGAPNYPSLLKYALTV